MRLRNSELIVLGITLLATAVGIWVYPKLPAQVASHWGTTGEVDGYMSAFWGAFIMPIVSLVTALLFIAIPRLDPKRQNIEQFRPYFDRFIISFSFFLAYIYALTLLWNLGYEFSFVRWLVPAFSVLFYTLGVLISHAKQNWTIGIRTPWTLSNEHVWDATHVRTGKLFRLASVVVLLGILLPNYAVWLLLVPILGVVLYSIIFSYLEFKKTVA